MKQFILLLLIFILSCQSPFSTEPTNDDLFSVSHNYNGDKIYHPTPVTIEWSNITIKQFKEVLIERSVVYHDSVVWMNIAHIQDSLQTTYTDTIDDDITFQYRVRLVDQNSQFIHALSAPLVIPNVTSLKVPYHYSDPQEAFNSKMIDDGDTIKIYPGLYEGNFQFQDKNITIRSTTIPEITLLAGEKRLGSVVEINAGRLEGLTLIGGKALFGGGISARGTASIKNCIIRNNRAINDRNTKSQIYPNGKGGGVYLQDAADIIKCKIIHNNSEEEGGGILSDGNNSIVNCTIYNNNSQSVKVGAGLFQYGGQLLIQNTKFKRNKTHGNGGAIFINASAEITNCLFEKNKSDRGGALTVGEEGDVKITNCVFNRNWSFSSAFSGAIINQGEIVIMNTIVWNNSGTKDFKLYARYAQYTVSDEFRIVVGLGNLKLNPLFVNEEVGNYHLAENSPCVDKGHPDGRYNDVDGSRNDLGIYGGPFGNIW